MEIRYDPLRLSPCGHIFCDSCVRSAAHAASQNTPFKCPLCRTNVDDYAHDYTLRDILLERYPAEYEARRVHEEQFPVNHALPQRVRSYDLLLENMKTRIAYAVSMIAMELRNVQEIVMAKLLYDLVISRLGVVSFLVVAGINIGLCIRRNWAIVTNRIAWNFFGWFVMDDMAKTLACIGAAVMGKYLGYERYVLPIGLPALAIRTMVMNYVRFVPEVFIV